MIVLPNFDDSFSYENGFYLTCEAGRIGKFLAHYELFKLAMAVPGALVECGVFKGASLSRFAMFRKLLDPHSLRRIVGFDMFGPFPETDFEPDKPHRETFVKSAGIESIGTDQLLDVLKRKGCATRVDLVAGNICETVPAFLKENPEFEISLLNLDTDIYEPAVTILENFFPRIKSGGILILDDYNVFPGETQAVDDYFADKNIEIKKFSYAATPYFIVKP